MLCSALSVFVIVAGFGSAMSVLELVVMLGSALSVNVLVAGVQFSMIRTCKY